MIGRRYFLPREVNAALEQVFAEPVGGIVVIENSLYERAHFGMRATTHPNRFEREAREFTAAALEPYLRYLGRAAQ